MMRTLIAQAASPTGQPLGGQPIQGPGAIGAGVTEALDIDGGRGVVDVFSAQLSNIIALITVIGGIFFVIYFLLAAFEWIRAGGDTGQVQKAQQKMINAAIGMLVMVVAIGLLGIISGVFGVDLLNPGRIFLQIIPESPAPGGAQ